jgi:hypothetical protein
MELNFTVTNQKIKYVSNLYIVEKSKNYLTAKFTFSGSEWKNVAKTAIFKKDDTVINVVLDESGRCEVPWEVITKGTLRVSVFGGDLVTVDTADVKILKSGYEEGNAPSKPTPDVYAQILSELQSIREETVTEEMVGQAVEDWLAENVVEALSPEDVENIVYEWLEIHKEEIKGEKGVTFTPSVSSDGVLSWTNDGNLENPEPYQFQVKSDDYVPTTRKIAGNDLENDITAEELVEAERKVSGQMYVNFDNAEEVSGAVFPYMPYPTDSKGNKLIGEEGQLFVANGNGTYSWLTISNAEGGAY